MTLIAAAIIGFVINDVAVYCWHRWVSHAGVLRWIANDVFRRRHFHHHIVEYPPEHLRAATYVESCDITFGSVEVLLLIGAAVVTGTAIVPLSLTLAAACGAAVHGWLAIRLHELCHAPDALRRRRPLSSTLEHLARFHDAHHENRGNYGLLVPILDAVVGTRVCSVSNANLPPAELFPGFQPERSSSCGEPLL